MSEQEKSGLAASAVAGTVEETINRVASLPAHILDNQELLEGFALEAFEQAAAANLPAVFSEATYRQRPELGGRRQRCMAAYASAAAAIQAVYSIFPS
jgi:hypothetical protein